MDSLDLSTKTGNAPVTHNFVVSLQTFRKGKNIKKIRWHQEVY